ncbi:DNA helicase [Burkholderia phage Bm1]
MRAAMSEAKLREDVKKAFKGTGAHLSWIESHATAAGFPDLELCHEGISQQIELKFADATGKVKIRQTQYQWFRHRTKAMGVPLLWVMHGGFHYLLPGSAVNKPSPLKTMADVRSRPHIQFDCPFKLARVILTHNRQSTLTQTEFIK